MHIKAKSQAATMPPPNINELMEGVFLGSTAQPAKLTSAQLEERELLKIQILSLGYDLNDDAAFQKWSNAELQQLLDALIATEDGMLEEKPQQQQKQHRRVRSVEDRAPRTKTENHIPGVNDLMSGALPPRRGSESSDSGIDEYDDPTVSMDTLPSLYRSMPHYMISIKILRTLNLFANPLYYDALPAEFFTTVKGLKRAWDEANAAQPDVTDDMDDFLFDAVLKRGGLVTNAYWSVKYPCDIVPPNGGKGDPEFWREIREMDWSVDERREREERENRRLGM